MANYGLVINSQFQPFTYQELVAPVVHQQQVMDTLADEYDKLSSQADILEAMGTNDRDKNSGTYSKFKAYSDAVRTEADNLYAHGLNSESRRRLSEMRRRYNTEIVPIQNAWNKRDEEAKLQLNARLKNPSLRFTRDASTATLDDYLANPTGGFEVVNLDAIKTDMQAAAKMLSTQVRGGYNKDIDEYTFNHISQFGLDPQLISNWAMDPSQSPTLTNMMNQVLQKHGITAEMLQQNPELYNEGLNAAQIGAWNAVGEDKEHVLENYGARQEKKGSGSGSGSGSDDENTGNALPGETVALNFSDAESAGNDMKRRLADATASYMEAHKNNPYVKRVRDYWSKRGGMNAAKQHWMEKGFNGDKMWTGKGDKNGFYYGLGNYLRENVTKNESIINTWRSGYAKESKAPEGDDSASSYGKNTYLGLDMYGNPINEETYAAARRAPGNGTRPAVPAGIKDWGDFDEQSNTGYRVNMIALNDKPEALASYLSGIVSRTGRDRKLPLYDIKKISGTGEYTYSAERMDVSELPHTSTGELDLKEIHRGILSNGDYILYWLDKDGNSVQKVLRRKDIGTQTERDWEKHKKDYNNIFQMYTSGKLSGKALADAEKYLGRINMENAYLDTQEVDVQDYKLTD